MPLLARRGPADAREEEEGGCELAPGLAAAAAAAAAGRRARQPAAVKGEEEAADGVAGTAAAAAAVEWTIDEVEDLIGLGKFQFFLLLIAGLGFAADCMEVTLMTFMGAGVSKEWGTHRGQALTTESALSWLGFAVFGGELAGCLFWGPAADRFGRQRAYLASCLLMLAASLASAVAPTFAFLLGARALVGFGIGGLAVPFDLLCEATPTKHRGTLLLLMQGFWVLGSVAVVALAWAVLAPLGWRWLTALAALPILVAAAATLLLPESPRWLMERGRGEEAWEVLVKAAGWNGVNLPAALRQRQRRQRRGRSSSSSAGEGGKEEEGEEAHEEEEEEDDEEVAAIPLPTAAGLSHLPSLTGHHHHRSSSRIVSGSSSPSQLQPEHQASPPHPPTFFATLPLLLSPALRRTTLWLWVVWLSFGLGYYGIVLYAAQLFSSSPDEAATGASFDFPPLLWSAASEALGVVLALLLLERWGRKGTQAATYLVAAVGAGLMGLGSQPRALGLGASHRKRLVSGGSVVARVGAMAASSTTWVATPEAYPTAVRSTGHSVASAVARIGAILAPQAVGAGRGSGGGRAAWGPAVILTAVSLLAAFAALMLPTETGGKALGDVDEAVEEAQEELLLLSLLQQSQSQSPPPSLPSSTRSTASASSPLLAACAGPGAAAKDAVAVVRVGEGRAERRQEEEEDVEMTLSSSLQQQQLQLQQEEEAADGRIRGGDDKGEEEPAPFTEDGSSSGNLGSRKSSASSFSIKAVAAASSFGKVSSLVSLLGLGGAAAAATATAAAAPKEEEEEKGEGIAMAVMDEHL